MLSLEGATITLSVLVHAIIERVIFSVQRVRAAYRTHSFRTKIKI